VHPTIVYRKSEHTVAIELHFYDSASISRQIITCMFSGFPSSHVLH